MPIKYYKKPGRKKKMWHKKRKQYRKPALKMYKVPKQKVNAFKRERWLDINFTAPGGSAWTAAGRTNADVLESNPLMNFRVNMVAESSDPIYSRVTWQPIFTFDALPELGDISGLFRLFKIHKISIALYPMRSTNPTQTASNTPINPVASNVIVTTMYAKTGLDARIGMGTDEFSQVERKITKLYNLGIGKQKLGWYFKPSVRNLTWTNPESNIVNVVDGQVNISDCFSHTVKRPGYLDIETAKQTEHYGPLISFRSVDGSSLVGGTQAGNNWKFRACIKYYFSVKGTH